MGPKRLQGVTQMEKSVKTCLHLRNDLKKSLEKDFPKYSALVRNWIRKKKSRPQLDSEVYSLLDEPVRKIHFDFLANVSKLCWGLSSLRLEEPVKAERSLEGAVISRDRYTDLNLPSLELIKARLYMTAWDHELVSVDLKVSRLLYLAMRNYIKDILHAVICDKPTKLETSLDSVAIWTALMQTNLDLPHCVSPFPSEERMFIKTL